MYLKFAVSRALIQRFKSTHVGGMLSAIGLLEVTSVQDDCTGCVCARFARIGMLQRWTVMWRHCRGI